MKLDADAAEFLRRLDEILPRPVHELGVAFGRALSMAGDAPAGPELWQVKDVGIGDVAERGWGVGNSGPPLRGRVYRPQHTSVAPALVYFHGGGWSIGSLDGVDAVCRALAAGSGCVVLSVDYHQAPEHPYPAPLRGLLARGAVGRRGRPDRRRCRPSRGGRGQCRRQSRGRLHAYWRATAQCLWPPSSWSIHRPTPRIPWRRWRSMPMRRY